MKQKLIVAATLLFAVHAAVPGLARSTETVDHVIVGLSDLQDGIAQFERLSGIRAVRGGVHPGRGTQNALVGLGPGKYLEILAPAEEMPLARDVSHLSELRSLTPMGWAVATDDIDGTARRLRDAGFATAPAAAGSRTLPDGTTLEWKMATLAAPDLRLAPFLIQWSAASTHPSASSPAGCVLRSLELTGPDAEALRRLVGALALDVVVSAGAEARMSIELARPGGRVVLGPGLPR